MLAGSRVNGFGFALDVAAFRRHFGDTLEEAAYYKLFTEAIKMYAEIGARCVPPETVSFKFESRLATAFSAGQIFNYLRNLPEWRNHSILGDVSFPTKSMAPELQAADLVARETMKLFDVLFRGGSVDSPRKSAVALAETRRFTFIPIDEDGVKRWRAQVAELESRTGLSSEQYADWRQAQNCPDNLLNRLRFLKYRDAQQRRGGGLVM
jgi:hypothetical protein